MIVLDTNVISEMFRPHPNARVVSWLESLTDAAVTAVTVGEILGGVKRLPAGRRRTALVTAVDSVIAEYRAAQRILPFDDRAASAYAEVLIRREQAGMRISTSDAQIAAICRAHDARCATRNVKDFIDTGVDVLNPWEERAE